MWYDYNKNNKVEVAKKFARDRIEELDYQYHALTDGEDVGQYEPEVEAIQREQSSLRFILDILETETEYFRHRIIL